MLSVASAVSACSSGKCFTDAEHKVMKCTKGSGHTHSDTHMWQHVLRKLCIITTYKFCDGNESVLIYLYLTPEHPFRFTHTVIITDCTRKTSTFNKVVLLFWYFSIELRNPPLHSAQSRPVPVSGTLKGAGPGVIWTWITYRGGPLTTQSRYWQEAAGDLPAAAPLPPFPAALRCQRGRGFHKSYKRQEEGLKQDCGLLGPRPASLGHDLSRWPHRHTHTHTHTACRHTYTSHMHASSWNEFMNFGFKMWLQKGSHDDTHMMQWNRLNVCHMVFSSWIKVIISQRRECSSTLTNLKTGAVWAQCLKTS